MARLNEDSTIGGKQIETVEGAQAKIDSALGSGGGGIVLEGYVTPEMFGAVGDGVTLDYQAFKDAIDEIISRGGGELRLKHNKTYLLVNSGDNINTEDYEQYLFMIGEVNGFIIDGNGSTLLIDDSDLNDWFSIFYFDNSKNITVRNIHTEGVYTDTKVYNPNAQACVLGLGNKVTDINFYNNSANFINAFVLCHKSIPTLYENQCKRMNIYNLTGYSVQYPLNFTNDGSDVKIWNVRINRVNRGYFIYGVKNHKVELEIDNYTATGALIKCYKNRGCENIDLTFRSHHTDDIGVTGHPTVALHLGDEHSAVFRNIKIHLDVKDAINDEAFLLNNRGYEFNQVPHNHVIDGLYVSGTIDGIGQQAVLFENLGNSTWDNVTMKNINFIDLDINNTNPMDINLEPLEGIASFRNIRVSGSNRRIYLEKSNANKDYLITFQNVMAYSIGELDFDAKASYEDCTIYGADQNLKNKTFRNVVIDGVTYDGVYDEQGDVIDDTSDLATKQEVQDVEDVVATHVAENATNAHLAKNIGLEDNSNNFTSANIEGAMSELFTNVSDGKNLVGGAITDVDENVVIPTDPTFIDLATAISGITTGGNFIRFARNVNTPENFTERYNFFTLTFTGIPFKPKWIFFTGYNSRIWEQGIPASYGSGGDVTFRHVDAGRAESGQTRFQIASKYIAMKTSVSFNYDHETSSATVYLTVDLSGNITNPIGSLGVGIVYFGD